MKNPYVLANQDDATPIKIKIKKIKKIKKKPDTSLSAEVGERYIYSFVFAQYLTWTKKLIFRYRFSTTDDFKMES